MQDLHLPNHVAQKLLIIQLRLSSATTCARHHSPARSSGCCLGTSLASARCSKSTQTHSKTLSARSKPTCCASRSTSCRRSTCRRSKPPSQTCSQAGPARLPAAPPMGARGSQALPSSAERGMAANRVIIAQDVSFLSPTGWHRLRLPTPHKAPWPVTTKGGCWLQSFPCFSWSAPTCPTAARCAHAC